jgi:integration host factor subunit alpha
MTKSDLADRLHDDLYNANRWSRRDCAGLIDLAFEVMKTAIVSDRELKVAGFGVFSVKMKQARRGRNPQTGDELTITARSILSFKASALLKQRINAASRPADRKRVAAGA